MLSEQIVYLVKILLVHLECMKILNVIFWYVVRFQDKYSSILGPGFFYSFFFSLLIFRVSGLAILVSQAQDFFNPH